VYFYLWFSTFLYIYISGFLMSVFPAAFLPMCISTFGFTNVCISMKAFLLVRALLPLVFYLYIYFHPWFFNACVGISISGFLPLNIFLPLIYTCAYISTSGFLPVYAFLPLISRWPSASPLYAQSTLAPNNLKTKQCGFLTTNKITTWISHC
jgi:hypothetical protein